jgi:hypothetical protein
MILSLVRVIGVFAIAHALSHVILPLRGSFEPATLIRDYTPVVLFIVCTMGFLLAGAGLLGVRVLYMFISPLLVLASGLSTVAIVHLGQPDLWGGVALNAIFFALGLWRGYAGWPISAEPHDHYHEFHPVSR